MKKITLIIAIVVVCLFASGCATQNIAPLTNLTGDYIDSSISITKVGEATSKVWLGFFGTEGFPSTIKVAQDNGITKIAVVEHYVTPGILMLWTDYTTRVSGQ
jgi:hypothetical protein